MSSIAVLVWAGTRRWRDRAKRLRRWRAHRLADALASLFAAALISTPAGAGESQQPQFGWREVWAGSDVTKDVWLLYTGVTLAPWSKDIYTNGWRIRSASGYGEYTFSACTKKSNCDGEDESDENERDKFSAKVNYLDVLVGYHYQFGDLTAKAFAGGAMMQHSIKHAAFAELAHGTQFGFKGALEFWLNLGADAWTSLDFSYSTTFETTAGRWRAGYRSFPTLSIGPELRFDSNSNLDSRLVRAGAFARYNWIDGELSLAAGVAQHLGENFAEDLEPYATLNVLFQF